jgi:hypothetical protein
MYFREDSPRDKQISDSEWDRRWEMAFGKKDSATLTAGYVEPGKSVKPEDFSDGCCEGYCDGCPNACDGVDCDCTPDGGDE